MIMANPMIIWLVVVIAMAVIEALTMGLTTIWFAAGGVGALIAAALGGNMILQVIVFIVVSIICLIFTRPIAVRYFNKDRERTNAESLIGRQAIVTCAINNLLGEGQATLNGMEWTARSANDEKIAIGEVVIVKEISGVKLIVERQQEEN